MTATPSPTMAAVSTTQSTVTAPSSDSRNRARNTRMTFTPISSGMAEPVVSIAARLPWKCVSILAIIRLSGHERIVLKRFSTKKGRARGAAFRNLRLKRSVAVARDFLVGQFRRNRLRQLGGAVADRCHHGDAEADDRGGEHDPVNRDSAVFVLEEVEEFHRVSPWVH